MMQNRIPCYLCLITRLWGGIVIVLMFWCNSIQAETRIIAAEGESGACWGTRETALRFARSNAKNSAMRECLDIGSGWHVTGEKYPGYEQCTPCTGMYKGEFKCTVTKAGYICENPRKEREEAAKAAKEKEAQEKAEREAHQRFEDNLKRKEKEEAERIAREARNKASEKSAKDSIRDGFDKLEKSQAHLSKEPKSIQNAFDALEKNAKINTQKQPIDMTTAFEQAEARRVAVLAEKKAQQEREAELKRRKNAAVEYCEATQKKQKACLDCGTEPEKNQCTRWEKSSCDPAPGESCYVFDHCVEYEPNPKHTKWQQCTATPKESCLHGEKKVITSIDECVNSRLRM